MYSNEQIAQAKKRLDSYVAFITRDRLSAAINIVAALAMAFAIGVSVGETNKNRAANNQAAELIKQANQKQTTAVPATIKPATDAVADYEVAPGMPRYLNIPKLGIHARIMEVGLGSDGSIGTPSNVFDTAWYSGSSKPGQAGAALIDGHVSSWTTRGVFYNLAKLSPGDNIYIQMGDGRQFSYKVIKTANYNFDQVDMNAVLSPVTPGNPGLNLITCSGQVISGTNEFNQRTVVFATQI